MIIPVPEKPTKRTCAQHESKIQAECFLWCWNNHPETRRRLFHVPNELANSTSAEGAKRRAMGVVSGVADLLLLMARGPYHGLCIEMKDDKGRQSEHQIEWQAIIEKEGYKYEVCRNLEQFQITIERYLSLQIKK